MELLIKSLKLEPPKILMQKNAQESKKFTLVKNQVIFGLKLNVCQRLRECFVILVYTMDKDICGSLPKSVKLLIMLNLRRIYRFNVQKEV